MHFFRVQKQQKQKIFLPSIFPNVIILAQSQQPLMEIVLKNIDNFPMVLSYTQHKLEIFLQQKLKKTSNFLTFMLFMLKSVFFYESLDKRIQRLEKWASSSDSLQLILMSHSLDVSPSNSSPQKSKDRNSCSTGVSEDLIDIEERITSIELDLSNLKFSPFNIFHLEICQPEINSKLHKKAIHILLNICWDRDIDQDCLFSALMIFYAYRAKCIIKKTELEQTIAVSILLGCKLFKPEKLSLNDLVQISNGKYSTNQFKQTESKILLALDFDLCPNNSVSTILASFELTFEERNELFCMMEVLLLKNSDVFWKNSVVSSLIKLVLQTFLNDSKEIKSEILDLVKSKEGEFILRKYSSKIDTEILMQKLSKD